MSKKKKGRYLKKKDRKPLIYIAVGLTLLIVFVLTIIFIKAVSPLNGVSQGIPLYTGTELYKYVDTSKTKDFVSNLLNYVNCTTSICIIMFGTTGCPHCQAMHSFFSNNINYSYYYKVLWVDKDYEASKYFEKLYQIEVMSGVEQLIAGGVPQILIVKNSSLQAIVVGEVRDQSFWNKILG